ncbi:MAG: carbonic anhydrase [Chitinophagaceae bacterium]|nr:carbonic anhydrase [Chitinophagaceae bacterium]
MKPYEKLLLENKAWAAEQVADDPEYFHRLAQLQSPEFLWIGCSDSRVPANQITGTLPGEVFVHRNIANLVVEDDLNLLSVLHYAVNYLKVQHVIICGHYGCGGIKAAYSDDSYGILDKWLVNIKKIRDEHRPALEQIKDLDDRADRLAELSVEQQVRNIIDTDIISGAWRKEKRPVIHGWIYGLKDGLIKPLVKVDPVLELHARPLNTQDV